MPECRRWMPGSRRAGAAVLFGAVLAGAVGCQSAGGGRGWFGRTASPETPAVAAAAPPEGAEPAEKSWWRRAAQRLPFVGDSKSETERLENVVRNPDGTWRVDPRMASQQEKETSGFAAAEQLFRDEDYVGAARAFKRIAKRHKDTPLEEEALFLQGESWFLSNHLPSAQDAYATLLTRYPTTRFLPQAIQRSYDIAFYWLEDSQLRSQGKAPRHGAFTQYVNLFDRTRPLLDTEGRAIETIETIQQHDPFGPLTDDAVMMAGAHKFTAGNYIQAAGYYDQVVNDQPKSEHAARAYVLGAQAFLRSYQGPSYDGSELQAAERLTRAALQRGPELSAEQRVRLEQDLRVIHLERAKREFAIGENYKRLRKPKAARFYFEKVLRSFADTDWARRAEEEIRKIDEAAANQKPGWTDRVAEKVRSWWPAGQPTAADAETVDAAGAAPPEPNARKPRLGTPPKEIDIERDAPQGMPRSGVDPY